MIINIKTTGDIDLYSVVAVEPVVSDLYDTNNIQYYNVLLLGGHTIKLYNNICKRDLFISEWIKAKSLQHSTVS